jgi:hypothetical protein
MQIKTTVFLNNTMLDLKEYGIDVGLLISGLFGAVLLTSKNSAKNLGKTISSLIGGAASANYITPIVISIAKLDDHHYHYGIAFLLGFLGLKGIEYFSSKLIPDEVAEETEEAKPVRNRRRRIK